jgi:hypothetical protein
MVVDFRDWGWLTFSAEAASRNLSRLEPDALKLYKPEVWLVGCCLPETATGGIQSRGALRSLWFLLVCCAVARRLLFGEWGPTPQYRVLGA